MRATDGSGRAVGCGAGDGSSGGGGGGGGGRQGAVSGRVQLLELCQRVLPGRRHPGLVAAQLDEEQSQLLGLRRAQSTVREKRCQHTARTSSTHR